MSELTINQKEKQRIISLDVIRGFAILGILFMNIQSFSMVGQAYLNPMAYGDMTGLNKWVWIISHVFADQKFMTIFSMLFGASILMITDGAERKTGSSLGIHYRRNFSLLLIGLAHAYLLWYGDILTPYAVCALLLYPLRKLPVRGLFIVGIALFSIASLIEYSAALFVNDAPENVIQAMINGWKPNAHVVQAEISAYLGSWTDQFQQRVKTATMMHTEVFTSFYFWRISGLMLLGMALFKTGFFQGDLPKKLYRNVLGIAGTVGLGLVVFGVFKNFEANWSIRYSQFSGAQFNYWGSLLMALAYVSLVVLILKAGFFQKVTKRLASVGRMALTNYLTQTLIGTFIFYGFGLGLFGQVERQFQFLILLGIWALQLYLSPIWLRHFQYGPFEWLWRSMTQLKWQKLKKG